MSTSIYPTDFTDQQWEIIAPLIPPAKRGAGHGPFRCAASLTVLYRGGCTWGSVAQEVGAMGEGVW